MQNVLVERFVKIRFNKTISNNTTQDQDLNFADVYFIGSVTLSFQ